MRELRGGLVYFMLVFGAGFVLGTARVILLVPSLGVRAAELLEMPVMLLVIVLAARLVNRKLLDGLRMSRRLFAGLVALALLLAAELLLAVALTGASIASYIASRDPVSGTVYAFMLVLFALMPAMLRRG
jgi:hypothetical protein